MSFVGGGTQPARGCCPCALGSLLLCPCPGFSCPVSIGSCTSAFVSFLPFVCSGQLREGPDLHLHRGGGGVHESLQEPEHLRAGHDRAVQGPGALREAAPPVRHRRCRLQSHEEAIQGHLHRHLR